MELSSNDALRREEAALRSSRWLLLLAVALSGCEAGKNKACEPCTNVSDCETGLTCQIFRDASQNEVNLCGDASTNMLCPPR